MSDSSPVARGAAMTRQPPPEAKCARCAADIVGVVRTCCRRPFCADCYDFHTELECNADREDRP